MKKYIIFFAALFTFASCTKSEVGTLGEWSLIAFYSDPGDGSGDFTPVDSEKTLILKDDGTFELKNGSLCDLGAETGDFSGTYNDSSMQLNIFCPFFEHLSSFDYDINDQDELLLYYPCIESCVEKYVRE